THPAVMAIPPCAARGGLRLRFYDGATPDYSITPETGKKDQWGPIFGGAYANSSARHYRR
ncbi:MAG: hypothetical protein NTW86_13505, partial [Candidatus Sumerlaeota bacterium]|nr:hypothetical protein [Candidatus Sumerlaeota bacterium]